MIVLTSRMAMCVFGNAPVAHRKLQIAKCNIEIDLVYVNECQQHNEIILQKKHMCRAVEYTFVLFEYIFFFFFLWN